MGRNRGQIKTVIKQDLDDSIGSFYSDDDLNESFQDAYDDIAALTQCINKTADNLSWIPNLVYYDPVHDLGIADYMGPVALFNYSTNRWLRDDLTLRDFDRIQRNWEFWIGAPQFWAPSDPQHFAIAPNYSGTLTDGAFNRIAFSSSFFVNKISTSALTFKLVYYATAPKLASDASIFLIASDMQLLLEYYVKADQLETAQEYAKANEYWELYYTNIEIYADRVKRANKHDLLLRA